MSENIILPIEYENIMKTLLKEDYSKYISALKEPPVRGLRVNTNKISVSRYCQLTNYDIEKLPFSVDGFILNGEEKVGNEVEHLAGLIYLQEPSSMLPVVASGIIEETRPLKVLDLCASPGGKTGQIASRVQSDSIIFSNEIIKSRADVLFSNVERLGFKNVVILNEEPQNLKDFSGYFDYVFVDAPCSGEGMFRKNPETIGEWSYQNVQMCQNRQKEILSVAEKLVAAGGKLVYSTCTFSIEEDEEIVDWFIQNFNFKLVDVPENVKSVTLPSSASATNGNFARKMLPFCAKGEGQFFAVFEKADNTIEDMLYSKKHYKNLNAVSKSNFELFNDFAKNNINFQFDRDRIFQLGDNLFYVPKMFDSKLQTELDDLKIISIGVKLGQIEKKIFKPHHSIFMAFSEEFFQKCELNPEEVKKYLHGEEIVREGLKGGYCVVTANGFGLGGVKISGNKLKNLYPKGIRL